MKHFSKEKLHKDYTEKITELAQCAHAVLKKTPNLPFVPFHQECLESTSVQEKTSLVRNEADARLRTVLTELGSLTTDPALRASLQQDAPPPKVAIIGAGLAGLFAAYVLVEHGIHPEIFESRPNEEARLRPQNISFKEAETCIKPILQQRHYDAFFERGGAMDGDSAKLRLTTGTFQDVLTEALLEKKVAIHFHTPIHEVETLAQQGFDVILIAAGVHSCERLALHAHFHPVYFPEYAARGRTALCIAPSDEAHGYRRSEAEGWSWQRNNKSVFSGQAFKGDLQRLIDPLRQQVAQEKKIAYLSHLMTLPSIEYTFNFGNDTPEFMNEARWPTPASVPDRATYIVQQWSFHVEPMIATQLVSQQDDCLLVAIGDANGSAHPLAALGTIKFCRNAHFLPALLKSYGALKRFPRDMNPTLYEEALSQIMAIFQEQALQHTHEVFWANICCSLFSRPR